MQYAVKVVTLPPTSGKTTATANNKKRKKTAAERNADLLLHEYTILQNSGAANRGTLFPDIPLMGLGDGPPGYGETVDKSEFIIYILYYYEQLSSCLLVANHRCIN